MTSVTCATLNHPGNVSEVPQNSEPYYKQDGDSFTQKYQTQMGLHQPIILAIVLLKTAQKCKKKTN